RGVGFGAVGEQALKNIGRKVVVYEVLLDGGPRSERRGDPRSDPQAAPGEPDAPERPAPSARPARPAPSARPARAAAPPARSASRGLWPLAAVFGLVVLLAL